MPKKRKLVFIIYSAFTDKPGGRENWIQNISVCLNTPVEIICYQNEKREKSVKSVKINRVRTLRSAIPYFDILAKTSLGILLVLDMIWFIAKTFQYVKKRRQNYESSTVFIAMNSVIEGIAALIIKKTLGSKVVVSVRGKSPLELSSTLPYLKPIVYKVERKVLKSANEVWTNGFDTAEYVKQITGKTPKVIPNGVNFSAFTRAGIRKPINKEGVTIMSVATLRPIKGIPQLIRSIPKIEERTSRDFKVVFAGYGNPQKYVRQLKKQNCMQYADFVGPIPSIKIIGGADIVVCVSGGSGMSMSAIEAMAAGKAIVAWDSSVYRQLLENEKSALLVPEDDVSELAKAIVRLIDNPKLRGRLGRRAQEKAKNYDWSNVCKIANNNLKNI